MPTAGNGKGREISYQKTRNFLPKNEKFIDNSFNYIYNQHYKIGSEAGKMSIRKKQAKKQKNQKTKKQEVIEPEVYEVSEDMKLEKHNAVMENSLIEARYSLTVEEQRLVLATIGLLDSMETAPSGFPMLRIPKKLIIETTGLHEKDYKIIKKSLERLMSRIITIETEKGFTLYQWFSKAEYNKGEEYIEVQFHPDLKPFLLELKERFTKIPLTIVLQLSSKYAIRLYELLKQYQETGYRIDKIEDLRAMLGVEKHEYKRFFDFERFVLKQAINEINEKTDLQVSYTKKKKGRRISQIEFQISVKEGIQDDNTITINNNNILNNNIETGSAPAPAKPKKFDKNSFWNEVKDYRKKYMGILQEYNEWVKQTKISNPKIPVDRYLTENQLLFLLINAEENGYPASMVVNAVRKTILNKQVKNPMGFLIDFFEIDMLTANYVKLTTTDEMLDKELIGYEGKGQGQQSKDNDIQAEYEKNKAIFEKGKKISQSFVEVFLEYLAKKRMLEGLGNLEEELKTMLENAVIDKDTQTVYIPAPDYTLLDWFDINFKDELENFIKSKTGKDFSVEVVLYSF